MKKILLVIIFIILFELIVLGVYFYNKKDNNDLDINNNINESSKEESEDDKLVKSFKKSEVFDINNLERYKSYYEKHNYSPEEAVMYVEIGLDSEFYTNIKEIENYDDTLVLVNKYNKLPSKFEAKDLITLSADYSKKKSKLKKIAADAIIKMMDDAKKENLNLDIISGYRTESYQNMLFTNSTNKNGIEHALIYSAKPGHSEHQTGLAADFNLAEEEFDKTNEFYWLKDNAHKYGFILRYPKDKEFITGYGYEPWHYRYVGVDEASIIYNENITFEEYFVKYLK